MHDAANSPALVTLGLAVSDVAAVALWMVLYRAVRPQKPVGRRIAALLRLCIGVVAWRLGLELLGRVVTLHAEWGLWIVSLCGAAAIEAVVALSARERKTVSRRVGRWMLAARMLLIVAALLIFLQPVFTYELDTQRARYVAVLWDDSASMGLGDPQSSPSEKLRLARLYELPAAAQSPRFDKFDVRWAATAQQCDAMLDGLPPPDAAATPASTASLVRRRKASILESLDRIDKLVAQQRPAVIAALAGPPASKPDLRAALQNVIELFDRLGRDTADARKLLASDADAALAGALGPLGEKWRGLRESARQLRTRTAPLAAQCDEAVWTAADPSQKREVESLVRLPRSEVARRALFHSAADGRSLWDALAADRTVRLYRFAATPAAGDVKTLRDAVFVASAAKPPVEKADATKPEKPTDAGKTEKSKPDATKPGESKSEPAAPQTLPTDPWSQATDLAAAMALVEKEIPADQLAGVLMLTDGRHNLGAPAEPIGRRLGQARVPLCTVVVGSEVAPADAALTGVTCPETVFRDDRVNLHAQVRAIGKRGQQLTVRLFCDDKPIQQRPVAVDSDDFRTTVVLGHTAAETGIHEYRVALESPPPDAIPENNQLERFVSVTDARIKMLLVDDRPRWDYRYVRNLFTGRDKTVQMQHLLLSPDGLGGADPRPRVAASASRPYGEFEATALPESPEEWLKFEVIVLGDLGPAALPPATIEVLERFVGKQGGTLIVLAGQNAMPHALIRTKLADLLPATFAPVDGPLAGSPEPAYRLALSPEGGSHMIMRVHPNPTENAAVWNSLPPMDWRHPVQSLKPGATVLAYAEPVDPETAYAADAASEAPAPSAAGAASTTPAAATVRAGPGAPRSEMDRMRLLRQNPLIVAQKYGAGNVLLLNFDRTWRLRYRVGDTYHHRFWSKVLRWATANKLAAGTPHVRLGVDRHRYQAGETVVVRTQLLDRGDAPIAGAKLTARVYRGGRLVLSKSLDPLPESRGIYQGELGGLVEPGRYRVEIEGPQLPSLLAIDTAAKVQTEFLVTALERTSELVDVGAEWRLPTQLAELSGGQAVAPCDASKLAELFTGGSKTVRQRQNVSLWDSWPMLLLALAAAAGEWILRKKVGLT